MLWLSGKVAALYELFYRELSQALPTRDWKWNISTGLASGFVEEFAFRGVGLAFSRSLLVFPSVWITSLGLEAFDVAGLFILL